MLAPRIHHAHAHAARREAAWRCGWCRRDRSGMRSAPAARETTGICEACLGARRAVGYTRRGPGFVVWDEDEGEATRWARELREAAAARRPRSGAREEARP